MCFEAEGAWGLQGPQQGRRHPPPHHGPLLSPPALPVCVHQALGMKWGGGVEMEVPLPEEQAEAGTADLKDMGPGATTDVQGTSVC